MRECMLCANSFVLGFASRLLMYGSEDALFFVRLLLVGWDAGVVADPAT